MDRLEIMELLDKYFNGPPSEADRRNIEQYRKTNPLFESIYQEYETTVHGIHLFGRDELKSDLKKHLKKELAGKQNSLSVAGPAIQGQGTDEESIQNPRPLRSTLWQNWKRIAAVGLLLIMALAGYTRYQNRYQRTYAAYQPDRLSAIQAGEGDAAEMQNTFAKSFVTYTHALELAQNPATLNEALQELQRIPVDIPYYYFWAQYEMALIYLDQSDVAASKRQLNKIIRQKGEHIAKEKAADLLQRLNSPRWLFF